METSTSSLVAVTVGCPETRTLYPCLSLPNCRRASFRKSVYQDSASLISSPGNQTDRRVINNRRFPQSGTVADSFVPMPLANIDAADLIFGLLFPPIGTLVVYGGAYAAARAVAGGQPLSKVTKKVLKWGAVFVLGVGYDTSLTKFLEWSPQTLWTSLPVWSFSLCQSCLLAERKDKRCSGHSLEN